MAEIRQLSQEVADQISAGEVIERPASVVKELVENSIDAESDKILIEIKDGGKEKIRVKDNGHGIKSDKLKLAFSRYATSKIENVNDIYSLQTLGFRGEALASIAAVSRVKALSKYTDEVKGEKIVIKGSEVLKLETTGCPEGTDITVTELFYNTPARFKYMKTTNTEFGHISDVITNEALAYPDIQFTLIHNGNQVLNTPGTGKLKDSIYSIYGKELVDNLIPVDFEDNYIQVNGYITRPDFNRSSRVYEKFFVNKRCIKNLNLNYGVEAAYQGLLPSGKYPVVFLNLKLNPILVDVNVHPTKKEVKFSRNQIIKNVLKKNLRKRLKENNPSSQLELKTDSSSKKKKKKANPNNKSKKVNDNQKNKNIKREKLIKNNSNKISSSTGDKSYREKQKKSYKNNTKNSSQKKTKEKYQQESDISNLSDRVNEDSEITDFSRQEISLEKIIGQLHNCFILMQTNKGLYIIDQHAAQERIIYENLYQKYNQDKVISQPLLVPVKLELTLSEVEILNKFDTELENIGIKIENFGGNSFIIQEVPTIIKEQSSKKVVKEILDNLINKGKTLKKAEIVEKMIILMSCKMAVKAGESLEKEEMKKLVFDLFQTENPYRCPHNRPVMTHLETKELEREVGRR